MCATIKNPLHAEVTGDSSNPPLVFVHPLPFDSAAWIYQVTHFSPWYLTIAVDLPGYGRSPAFRGSLTMQDIAEACWRTVDRYGRGRAVLVGCSIGATAVQHMYHLDPERTAGLVLAGCGFYPTRPFVARRTAEYRKRGAAYRRKHALDGFSEPFRSTSPAKWIADLLVERNETADLDTMLAIYEALDPPDPEWLQRDIAAPVLILSGTADKNHEAAYALQERFQDCELHAIKGAGHVCQFEQPWEFDHQVATFLHRIGHGSSSVPLRGP